MVYCAGSRRDSRGFTLIEVMVAVAIIAVLAAVAVPIYRQHQLKSKAAEARTSLGAIATLQTAFYAEWDAYVPCSASQTSPLTPARVLWPRPAPGFDVIGFAPAGAVYYSYEVTVGGSPVVNVANSGLAGGEAFAASAVADLDGDGLHGEFVYSSDTALAPRTPQLAPGHGAVRSHAVESLTAAAF